NSSSHHELPRTLQYEVAERPSVDTDSIHGLLPSSSCQPKKLARALEHLLTFSDQFGGDLNHAQRAAADSPPGVELLSQMPKQHLIATGAVVPILRPREDPYRLVQRQYGIPGPRALSAKTSQNRSPGRSYRDLAQSDRTSP